MTQHKHLLHNLQPLTHLFLITLPNWYKVKIVSTGSLDLRDDITLHNVLLHPSFHFNLLSIFQLIKNLLCLDIFFISTCHLKGPSLKRTLEVGKAENGLYYFHIVVSASIDFEHLSVDFTHSVPSSVPFSNFSCIDNSRSYVTKSSCTSPKNFNKIGMFLHHIKRGDLSRSFFQNISPLSILTAIYVL